MCKGLGGSVWLMDCFLNFSLKICARSKVAIINTGEAVGICPTAFLLSTFENLQDLGHISNESPDGFLKVTSYFDYLPFQLIHEHGSNIPAIPMGIIPESCN